MSLHITIPIRPVTKKNHQRILKNFSTGRRFIGQSEQYEKYEGHCLLYLKAYYRYPGPPIDYPVNLKCIYYMPTKHRVDLANLMAATHDILVKAEILKDDDTKIVASVDGSRVYIDKDNPRTEIFIETVENK